MSAASPGWIRALARATLPLTAALGLGCASASPVVVASPSSAPSVSLSPVTAPLAARIVPADPPLSASDLAAASLVTRVEDVALHHDAGSPRKSLVPAAFRIADLPSIDAPRPLDAAHPPIAADGIEAAEIVLDWHSTGKGPAKLVAPTVVRVGLSATLGGRLRIGSSESAINDDGSGGVFVTCGGPQDVPQRLVPARWETAAVTPDHQIAYQITTAWFDPRTCTAHVVERASVQAAPLAGGLLQAFRQRCEAPCVAGELVTILGPRFEHLATSATFGNVSSADGNVTRVTLPVRQGGGASMVGSAKPIRIASWARPLGVAVPRGGILVGVEIVHGVDDLEPVAIAYIGAAP